jgi:hypothetical protein
MNYLKWLRCWWNKKHTYCWFRDSTGAAKRMCVVCGAVSDEAAKRGKVQDNYYEGGA